MTGRFRGADGIRGLACLIVLCTHAPGFFFPDISRYFLGTGKIGVWLFFVLSAFLLANKFERNGFSLNELAAYMVGRVLRIIPLFLIIAFFYWIFGSAGIDTSGDLWRTITFQSGYVHLWTIPVEFKFYGLLPLIALAFLATRHQLGQVPTLLLCATLILGHQLVWPYWDTPDNSVLTRWYLPSFILGCYIAVLMPEVRKNINERNATLVGFFVITMLVALTPGVRNYIFGMPFDRWLMDKFVFLSALWALFLLFHADGKGLFGRVLKHKVFVKLGAWSYSIYLIHWMVYSKLSAGHQNSLLWSIFSLFVAVLLGAVIYYLIESPIERFRHSLQSKIQIKMLVSV